MSIRIAGEYPSSLPRRSRLLGAALALLAVAAWLGGCREEIELNDLQKMQQAFRALPAEEQEPALRRFAAESETQSHFAWFELGNVFYNRAGAANVNGSPEQVEAAAALMDSARIFFTRAIAGDSTFVEAHVNLGALWEDLALTPSSGAREQAQACYQRAIELRPDDEKARCNLGALYYQQRQHESALAEFNHVLEVNPKSALAHYNLAILFADSRIYREAMHEWELAAKYDRDGDIGERSRRNIQIIKDLLDSEIPDSVKGEAKADQSG